jgi:hypothetical protein
MIIFIKKSEYMSQQIRYFLIGVVPVKYIRDVENGLMTTQKYESTTGCFVKDDGYIANVRFRIDDIEELTKEEFIQQLEELRAYGIKAEGELAAIYNEIRLINDTIRSERRRRYTVEERQRLAELTQKSYHLFESTIGRNICGHDEQFE